MNYQDTLNKIKNLEFDKELPIYKEDEIELYVLRPSKLSNRFKTYDVKKNFQIWLRSGQNVFRPNHLRVIIDLHLRVRSRPDLKNKIALAFDNIFYCKDPDMEVESLKREKFEHYLNPIGVIANLSQLFLIEQEYSYYKESKYDPSTLFYQGWIRQAIDSVREIDNIVMSIASRQPPSAKYTSMENKKSKHFKEALQPLWYLSSL